MTHKDTATAATLNFQPNRITAFVFASVFGLTALLLFWLGFVLRPEDQQATDGIHRILFTVVPMRGFSWAASLVFAVFACRLLRYTRAASAQLSVDRRGLTLADGTLLPWNCVEEISPTKDQLLQIALKDSAKAATDSRWRRLLLRFRPQRHNDRCVHFSSFDLGMDPVEAAERIAALRPANVESDDASESDDTTCERSSG